jgi:hypothetical protein
MLADEPDAVAQREPLVRPLRYRRLEGCLSDRHVADSGNRPPNVLGVPVHSSTR